MNKLEAAWAAELTERLEDFQFESVKLRLGNGAWYTPDFAIFDDNGLRELHEVKGPFARTAAIVRLKAAAARYPQLVFFLLRRNGGAWVKQEVESR